MQSRADSHQGTKFFCKKRHVQIHNVMVQENKPRTWKDQAISFGPKDLERVHTSHDDTIVITAIVYNHVVRRVLFDNGSGNDVLYYDAMKKLGILDDQLKPFPMSLIKFKNEKVKVQGVVTFYSLQAKNLRPPPLWSTSWWSRFLQRTMFSWDNQFRMY